ncbi:NAD-dependent epimerase/dehydratase family protein [Marinomonas sp. 15G1-11]|uniref:NAD-dependent epimerase/dehydratase family protein n=1 Tax=Marinomonas phaeophyticola TaxID=3004091 RepID=A0ABT4JYQ8_9GAMM|nr:NAD-dependent epimerase/dehydratase family protein [Marinomonas sp. 15G1-11]MCZ2722669.1 NAD-dependent epimerase/dehydratase family protein [Marinomonas sp. 15G1-11]
MARILIAGCGDIGSRLASNFIKMGHSVTGIRYQGREFPAGVLGITGDLVSMDVALLPDTDMVFLIMTPKGRTTEGYRDAYLKTAQRLLDRYRNKNKSNLKVFFVSSTSVYGQNAGESLDETILALPSRATAQILLNAESLLSEQFSTTSIRFSGIYGPGRLRLIESVANRECWAVNQWTNRIHRDDCVHILAFLANKHLSGVALDAIYIGTDHNPVSQWEVKLWLANQLKVEPNLPTELGVAAFLPVSGKQLSNLRIVDLGYQFMYPNYMAGYRGLLEEYQNRISH